MTSQTQTRVKPLSGQKLIKRRAAAQKEGCRRKPYNTRKTQRREGQEAAAAQKPPKRAAQHTAKPTKEGGDSTEWQEGEQTQEGEESNKKPLADKEALSLTRRDGRAGARCSSRAEPC